jgi:hypothetical protein
MKNVKIPHMINIKDDVVFDSVSLGFYDKDKYFSLFRVENVTQFYHSPSDPRYFEIQKG